MNVFDTLRKLETDPLNGSYRPPPKRTIKDYQLFQVFAKSEASAPAFYQQAEKARSKFQYVPSVLSIIISFVGWAFEVNQPTLSINFCNFLCLLIFLPLYILCDAEIISPRRGTHSKDIQLLDIPYKCEQYGVECEPYHYEVAFECGFVREKFEQYVRQHFDAYFEELRDPLKTLIIKAGRVSAINTELVYEGDIIVLQRGQRLSFDCYLLPVYFSQEFSQIDLESVYSGGRSFGRAAQPVIEMTLNKQLLTRLKDYFAYESAQDRTISSQSKATQYYELPATLISTPTECSSSSGSEPDLAYTHADRALAGYVIDDIANEHDIYWNNIDVEHLLKGFLAYNRIEDTEIAAYIRPGEVVAQYMQKHYKTITYYKAGKTYIYVIVARGCYAICTSTMHNTAIVYSIVAPVCNPYFLNGDSASSNAKYTFFSHLESLGKSLKMLPATLLLSLFIIVAPHIPRLIILPDYYISFSQAFKAQTWYSMLLHGFVPTMCASLSFCLCSLYFAHHVATLLRPMLKSASAYVKIFYKRMMLIPSLGSLESLGFTNAIVVQDANLLVPKYQLSICALGMNNYGNMKVFNANEAAQQVFKNRLKKPLLVFPTENDKSYWICFIRLVTSLSLQNEEIANILLQKNTTANYHQNIYNPNYNGPNYVDAGEISQATLDIINTHRNLTFEMTQQLGNFKAGRYLDFGPLIQPSCLLEANLSVTQIHPLQTKPYLVFYANLPIFQIKNMVVVRSSSCKDMVAICHNILTTASMEINSSSEQLSQEEYCGQAPFLLMNLAREVQYRQLRPKDIEKLLAIDKECYKKCYYVEHYAVALISANEHYENIHEMFREKRFTYVFHICFQPQAYRYAANFVKRFYQEYNGINLFITTKLAKDQCRPLLNAFNLQEYCPKDRKEPVQPEELVSEENISFYHDNHAIANAITHKYRRLMKNCQSYAAYYDYQLCQLVSSSDADIYLVKDYILSKNILKKQHLIEQRKQKRSKPKDVHASSTTEADALLDQTEMMEVDYDDSMSESEILRLQQSRPTVNKKHKRRKAKPSQYTSLFIVTEVEDSLSFSQRLYDAGLFVSWISDQNGPTYDLYQVTERNAVVKSNLKPDFLIINSEEQPVAAKIAVNRITESARVSICSIRGKYALERLLDACQEIPFYFMTLSPVFLGTIRSRQLVGLLPIFLLLSIVLIEIAACVINKDDPYYVNYLQVRPFFMPPVAVGIILLFSMIYIELLLPLIIWTPPSATAVNYLYNRHPNYVGNRAAMLYDFNKLLPYKTSSRALLIFSAIFTFLSLFVLIPSLNFYDGIGQFQDDFISVQLLKLSPFVSLFYCMIFTSFAIGALIISNKLPLGRVWGYRLPKAIYIKKALIFVFLYLFALVFIFVLPTATQNLSLLVLGFYIDWIDNNYLYCVLISFVVAVVESIGVILEYALFVRIN